MIIDEDEYNSSLAHYGTKRHSGRYPWGSGQTPDAGSFLGQVDALRKQGMKDADIAKAFGLETTTKLRAHISIAGAEKKAAQVAMAQRLKAKQMSNTAIAERMFGDAKKESTVRGLLAPGAKDKSDALMSTADMIRRRVDEKGMVDISKGNDAMLGLAKTRLDTAVEILKAQGYVVERVKQPQLGTGHDTNTKVLAAPGTKWQDIQNNLDKIAPLVEWTPDNGRTWVGPQPPISASSKKLQVIYGPEGAKSDGVIYIRPGADGLDMGGMKYAQARILVDGTHYMKGMAVLKDNLPDGVDIQFHTNKTKGTPILGTKDNTVLKPAERDKDGNVDKDNPFGASIHRQITDASGKKVLSAINIVNEDATWDDWSRNLASQMLSKQKPTLVKSQLDVTYAKKKAQLDEIMSLTNPTVKERLLRAYADDMDASSVHLKAAAMPRQRTHVILPINTLKNNEVFAPGYKDGETVVLIRYPHGGKFEIPELTVNNRNPTGRKLIGPDSIAAVGINHNVAKRLSGADFDGDTVVVIPNNRKRISTEPPLPGLKDFDPQSAYPGFTGMKRMSNTQTEMGMISNLITDMTIKGANHEELARAVRHSMVVIDAEKHSLNYKQSAVDNGITALRKKYQRGAQGGASTLISKTTGPEVVPDFKPRPAKDGGPIDKTTGKLVFVPSGKTKSVPVKDSNGNVVGWEKVPATKKVQRGTLYDNAFDMIEGEGTPVERLYAQYSNDVKALANKARYEMVNNTRPLEYSPSAARTYSKEVASLNAKLNTALKNAPLERQAQRVAAATVKLKKAANPNLAADSDLLKKTESQELKRARDRVGATRQQIKFTDDEWRAVQEGAISSHKLKEILDRADIDHVKQLATPRTRSVITPSSMSRARSLANAGYTQAEIAEELGISVSALRSGLSGS